MCVLALDSSAASCSVAVMRGAKLLAEETQLSEAGGHTRQLMPLVHKVLDQARLGLSEIKLLAVTVGPGTFTGLRVGLATAQGLALAIGQALVGISTLEALATQALPFEGLICALLDARRDEVYAACYQASAERLISMGPETVGSLESALPAPGTPCVFIGPGASRYRVRILEQQGPQALLARPEQHVLSASSVARMAVARGATGERYDNLGVDLNYLRPADALPRRKRSAGV